MRFKTLLLLSGLGYLPFLVHGQQKTSRFSVAVNAGLTTPVGRFADKNAVTGVSTGAGKTGGATQLTIGYALNPSFGLVLAGGYSWNKWQINSMFSYDEDNSTHRYTNNAGDWKVWRMMGGGSFTMPLASGSKWYFHGKLMAGVCKTAVPERSQVVVNSSTGLFVGYTSMGKQSMPWALCYQAEAGLQYQISNHFAITAAVNYSGARPVYKQYYAALYDPEWISASPKYEKQRLDLSVTGITAGVAFRL